ncbi:MAG: (2Fe-2S)-binding protein [Firmicutes bacterium]|nr:(2Fe-2S)-binding protein [Bacillota bacterium]
MRIKNHPILNFKEGKQVSFVFDGKPYKGEEGKPISCALHDNDIMLLGHSHTGRARGLYCAIGNCSACLATVNGVSNVRLCVEPLTEGTVIQKQFGKGIIKI